jgi:uncharacterized DUF497 family protein
VRILWDDKKNRWLLVHRGVSFDEAAMLILKNETIGTIKNPTRSGQFYFLLSLKGYVHVVPFVINDNEEMILKTIFPSRKFHKKYGGKQNEK